MVTKTLRHEFDRSSTPSIKTNSPARNRSTPNKARISVRRRRREPSVSTQRSRIRLRISRHCLRTQAGPPSRVPDVDTVALRGQRRTDLDVALKKHALVEALSA